jgi:hypothetical protein
MADNDSANSEKIAAEAFGGHERIPKRELKYIGVAGPTVFTPFAERKARERKCLPAIILLWTIAEARTCVDILWELRLFFA